MSCPWIETTLHTGYVCGLTKDPNVYMYYSLSEWHAVCVDKHNHYSISRSVKWYLYGANIIKKKVLSSNHSNHVDCSLQTYTQCSVSAAILIEYAEMWIIFAYPGKIYSNFVQKTLRWPGCLSFLGWLQLLSWWRLWVAPPGGATGIVFPSGAGHCRTEVSGHLPWGCRVTRWLWSWFLTRMGGDVAQLVERRTSRLPMQVRFPGHSNVFFS